MAMPRHRPLTLAEYLRLEADATIKHEFVAGERYAMAGVTRRHARIVSNLVFRLRGAAQGGPCDVLATDVKLRAAPDVIYYPDLMVICKPGRDDDLIVSDPCLIVEVTSLSTAHIDRREKLAAYRRLPSLRAYLIVDQHRRHVEHHWRDSSGAWWSASVTGDERLSLPCPDVALTLDQIYEGVQLPAVEEIEGPAYHVG